MGHGWHHLSHPRPCREPGTFRRLGVRQWQGGKLRLLKSKRSSRVRLARGRSAILPPDSHLNGRCTRPVRSFNEYTKLRTRSVSGWTAQGRCFDAVSPIAHAILPRSLLVAATADRCPTVFARCAKLNQGRFFRRGAAGIFKPRQMFTRISAWLSCAGTLVQPLDYPGIMENGFGDPAEMNAATKKSTNSQLAGLRRQQG